ncbi:unnamed protein product [Echinostoma caproni]|uniref:Reverse transcriptase domain-containing protein n=1 Tax=Echinostoma caproni TaxID=27848 RepID=A0A183AR68_9TREM|nr:unnamed protein product [Echinostoma caproni]
MTALQTALNRIKRFATEIGFEITPNKTKMFATPPDQAEHPLQLDGRTVEIVSDFKYLGSTILPNGQAKDDVKRRIDTARTAFLQLRTTLWRQNEISLKTKLKVLPQQFDQSYCTAAKPGH